MKCTTASAATTFKSLGEALEKAKQALMDNLGRDLIDRLGPYGSSEFDTFDITDSGITLIYTDRHDNCVEHVHLTAEDLDTADPAKSYLDRKKASREADSRERELRELRHRLARLSPEDRSGLLAQTGEAL